MMSSVMLLFVHVQVRCNNVHYLIFAPLYLKYRVKQSQMRLVPVDSAIKGEGSSMSCLYVLGLCLLFSIG